VPQVAASGLAMRTFVREPDRSLQDVVPCDRLPAYGHEVRSAGPLVQICTTAERLQFGGFGTLATAPVNGYYR